MLWYKVPKKLLIRSKATAKHKILVARGEISANLITQESGDVATSTNQPILMKPVKMEDSTTETLRKNLTTLSYGLTDMSNVDFYTKLSDGVDRVNVAMCPDKAETNVKFLKQSVYLHNKHIAPTTQDRVTFSADTCMAHSHHRGKLAIPKLKHHTLKSYSISHTDRLGSIKDAQVQLTRNFAAQHVDRIVGPAPLGRKLTYADVANHIFHFGERYHKRKFNRNSVLVQDHLNLGKFANGDMLDPDGRPYKKLRHHCWDETKLEPCCSSQARIFFISQFS